MHLAAHQFPAPGSSAPPVVLLHGFTSSATEDFIATGWPQTLGHASRSVIAIDLPGHGGSPGITTTQEARTSAVIESILTTIQSIIGQSEYDVLAYSLGSRLAWDLAGASPLARRLVLGGLSPFEPFAGLDHAALSRAIAGEGALDPLIGIMAGMVTAPGRDTASLVTLMQGLAEEPFDPTAPGPRVPTLLVAGATDPMTTGIEAIAETLSHASLTQVPGDHRGALDGPEFREAAIRFLS